MKCDGLKEETIVPQGTTITLQMYPKAEVDEAIAELKAEVNNLLIQNQELCQALQVMYSVEEYTELKVENCGLRRALWLTRALRARDIQRWWLSATCAPVTERACRIWNNVERKCRAMAEEYK